jgi:hypothetical protein
MKKKIRKALRTAVKGSRKKAAKSVRSLGRSVREVTHVGIDWTSDHYHSFKSYVESPEFEAHLDDYAQRVGVKFDGKASPDQLLKLESKSHKTRIGIKLALLGAACTFQVRASAKTSGKLLAKAGPKGAALGGLLGGGAQAVFLAISLYRVFGQGSAKAITAT